MGTILGTNLIVSSQTLNFEMNYFITWWIFLTECWCNGLLNCVPFTYTKIFWVQVHFNFYKLKEHIVGWEPEGVLMLHCMRMVLRKQKGVIAMYWDSALLVLNGASLSLLTPFWLSTDDMVPYRKLFTILHKYYFIVISTLKQSIGLSSHSSGQRTCWYRRAGIHVCDGKIFSNDVQLNILYLRI